MTQHKSTLDSPVARTDFDNSRPEDDQPASSKSAPLSAESAQKDAHGHRDQPSETPILLTRDASNPEYRPPEAVPLPESNDWSLGTGRWAERDTSHEWGVQPNNDWGNDTTSGWANSSKPWELSGGTIYPDHWGGLGVLGSDEPVQDDTVRWWDPEVQLTKRNPGPGMIAPRAIELIHDTDHILYEVSISGNPTVESNVALSPKSSVTSSGALNSSSNTPAPTPSATLAAGETATAPSTESAIEEVIPHIPPTAEELRDATPHPSALYCRRHHGWVVLSVTTASATASHLSVHWCSDPEKKTLLNKLPESSLRTDKNCLEVDTSTNKATANSGWNSSAASEKKMHHFHRYPNTVAGSGLFPAMKYQALSPPVQPPKDAHSKPVEDIDMRSDTQSIRNETQDDVVRSGWEQAPPLDHFDLYLCCQCKVQIICSPEGNVIPGILPLDALEAFIQHRGSNPKPGQTKEQSALSSLEMMLRIVEEPLWMGNQRSLTIGGKLFAARIGWSESSRRIFECMGFTVDESRLTPPSLNPITLEGRASRQRLIRIWVEIGAILADYRSRYPKLPEGRKNYIRLTSSREMLSERLGSHPDKIPRIEDISAVATVPQKVWETLGITRSTATPDTIETAYRYQLRCDPPQTPVYYEAIYTLGKQSQIPNVSAIKTLVTTEESKGRWTPDDLRRAANELGFGPDGVIKIEYIPEEASDDFLLAAFDQALKSTASDPIKRTSVKNSLRILAESRASEVLMKRYEQVSSPSFMDIDEAYKVLEVSKEVDDDTLVVVYQVRIADSPYSQDRMKTALTCVAEDRKSARLKELVETGIDPGKPPVVVPQEYPRGLQQLGNTCYLNSLLQYFYTIKELREVIESGNFDLDAPILDEDLLKHRIGGRLVTRHEVERSKKFVKLLSGLFMQMMCADEAAITPEIELAKLALVTSKDEEEDAVAQNATVTTEPGEVSDNPAGASGQAEAALKDTSTEVKPAAALDPMPSDATGSIQDIVMASRPASPPPTEDKSDPDVEMQQSQPPAATIVVPVTQVEPPAADEDNLDTQGDTSGDSMIVEMGDEPPNSDTISSEAMIAARKKSTMIPDSGAMMFGKQHDVSEVFDNCMFQIETALRFEKSSSVEEGSGTIKKLFYGKLLQRLSPIIDPAASPTTSKARAMTVHEKEDLFSHLLVNVSDEGFDLYDGLSRYFEDEVEHGGKRAKMEVSLLDIPPILQIQLQRVQFNRETMQAFKSNAYVKFEETLAIDRFLANMDPVKKAASKAMESELYACRERLRELASTSNPGDNNKLVASIAGTKSFLTAFKGEHPGIDEELIAHLKGEIISVEDEITQCRSRSQQLKEQLEAFWKDEREAEYQLASVFIHRGTSPSFGHYFFYSRNLPEKPDEWFKYNDSEVTPVPKDEVLADGTGSTANPYLLVYVRKGYDVMDTIHRVALE